MTEHEKQAAREAFKKFADEQDYHEGNDRGIALTSWQARGTYEAKRAKELETENAALKSQIDFLDGQLKSAKKLVEALESIATGKDKHGMKVDFCSDIATDALREYQGGEQA